MVEVSQEVDETIAGSAVVVYSKSYCGHSQRAKKMLREVLESGTAKAHDNYKNGGGGEGPMEMMMMQVVELDQLGPRGIHIQTYLAQLTHQRTVPNIFIHQKHIGGADDLTEIYQTGQLPGLIFEDSGTTSGSQHGSPSLHSRLFAYTPGTHKIAGATHHPAVVLLVVGIFLAGLVYRFVISRTRASAPPAQTKQKL